MLMEPWIGAADDDDLWPRFRDCDPNDKASVLAAVQADLLPHFMKLPWQKREEIASALIELQSLDDWTLGRYWDANLPPFGLPDRPQDLFAWVREALGFEAR